MKIKSFMDYFLSLVLFLGLLIAIVIVSYGGIELLIISGNESGDYSVFKGEPESLKSFAGILQGFFNGNPLGIIQMGLLILIATPIIRVASCLVLFAIQRDFLYVLISGVVLGILLISNC